MKVDTGQPPPHKGCNSNTCCSPARLWRTLQNIIKENDRKGLLAFFKDPRQEHIVRVALSQRVPNDPQSLPASHRHHLVRYENPTEAHLILGKSLTDLNSLQLALLTSSEPVVMALLGQLKLHAKTELKSFVHHVYGQGNTSLHLAVYLNRPRVVKALIELGASLDTVNKRNKTALDCCHNQEIKNLLSPPPIVAPVAKAEEITVPKEVTAHTEEQVTSLDPYLLFFQTHVCQHVIETAISHYFCKQTIHHYNQSIKLPQEKKPPDIAIFS